MVGVPLPNKASPDDTVQVVSISYAPIPLFVKRALAEECNRYNPLYNGGKINEFVASLYSTSMLFEGHGVVVFVETTSPNGTAGSATVVPPVAVYIVPSSGTELRVGISNSISYSR
jgi:hypothetical protein